MNRNSVLALLATAILLSGCAAADRPGRNPGIVARGSGRLLTREIDISGFTTVEASNAFEVDITYADAYVVRLTVDDNLLEFVQIRREGNRLIIGLDSSRVVALNNGTLRATVVMPRLQAVRLSGGARANVGVFSISGTFAVYASGASTFKGDINATRVTAEASGASSIGLVGHTEELAVNASGASRADLSGLRTTGATADLSGAATVMVTAEQRLDYSLSGGSRLEYQGQPAIGKAETSGGSTVVRR